MDGSVSAACSVGRVGWSVRELRRRDAGVVRLDEATSEVGRVKEDRLQRVHW